MSTSSSSPPSPGEELQSSMPELIDFDSKSDNPRSIIEDDSARFAGKTIVITGAGGLLGREGCIFFCKRGARIAAMDQDAAALKETFLALQTELGHEGELDEGMVVCPGITLGCDSN
jgi:hypothetical protein